MWYALIRIVITAAIMLPLLLLYAKSKKKISKLIKAISIILLVVLFSFIWYGRFENLFITFSSPEAAYHYSNLGTIDVVIEGEESTMIICNYNSRYRLYMLPKTETGWKLSTRMRVHLYSVKSDYDITIYRYGNTDNYYVWVTEFGGPEIVNITDNKGKEFQKYISHPTPNGFDPIASYYSYIEDIIDYELIIDENIIEINESTVDLIEF